MAGRVEQIWIKRAKLGVMDPVQHATLIENKGIVGNANQRGRRQVTILESERWQEHLSALDASLDPSKRRANILVSGIALKDMRNQVLQIGAVRLRIAGETKPCERMDEALPGLQAVMRPAWGGGAFAIVLEDGDINVGDEVKFVEQTDHLPLLQRMS
ncbi:MAG: MOSC domain-containing protein [Gemmatimonadaceae bacterium]